MEPQGAGFVFHAATAEGQGGIALVELYGGAAEEVLARLFRPRGSRLPRPGEVKLGTLIDSGGDAIDEVLLSSVPGEASWCKLPCWTLSTHGGLAVRRRLRDALESEGGREEDREGIIALSRSRGSIDSIQADALLLLPGARTERAALYLLRMAGGAFSARLRELLHALRRRERDKALSEVEEMLRWAPSVLRLFAPRRILIAGRPNAGKSSLLNSLAERERAIVSSLPGTTRDLIEETVSIAGYPVVFVDSSGIRPDGEPADPAEREGMRRARAASSDCVLFLLEHTGPPEPDEDGFIATIGPERLLIVRTKADLRPGSEEASPDPGILGRGAGWISSLTGAGLGDLRERIRKEWLGPGEEEALPPAPFTEAQFQKIGWIRRASSVDSMLETFVECFPDLGMKVTEENEPRRWEK